MCEDGLDNLTRTISVGLQYDFFIVHHHNCVRPGQIKTELTQRSHGDAVWKCSLTTQGIFTGWYIPSVLINIKNTKCSKSYSVTYSSLRLKLMLFSNSRALGGFR